MSDIIVRRKCIDVFLGNKMYHNDYYILERLLKQIDSKNFDIYLHVDKKVKNFDFEYTKKILKTFDICSLRK